MTVKFATSLGDIGRGDLGRGLSGLMSDPPRVSAAVGGDAKEEGTTIMLLRAATFSAIVSGSMRVDIGRCMSDPPRGDATGEGIIPRGEGNAGIAGEISNRTLNSLLASMSRVFRRCNLPLPHVRGKITYNVHNEATLK